MSTNEQEVAEVTETEEAEVADEVEETDTTDWKAIALRNAGIAKRNATRLAKLQKAAEAKVESPADSTTKTKKEEKNGFDFAEKAYLKSAGLKASEFSLVEKYVSAGKDLDEILDEDTTVGKLFQAELKEVRETQASKDAIPTGSKRSAPVARDTVEYWVAKGELPPADQVELRRKVVNAKLKASTDGTKFSPNPIV